MIQIRDYVRPVTLEEAGTLLDSSRNTAVIGGGAFLRLGKRNITTAVDLSALGLESITEDEDSYTLGAMVTFGDLERSSALNSDYHGLFSRALLDVVGVQFRNTVTVGGTVFSRYGFSDLIPSLLALGAEVVLLRQGRMTLEHFLKLKKTGKDILVQVIVPKGCRAASYQSVRLSTGDYAALNLVLLQQGGHWRIAVGARPGAAALASGTMELLNRHPWSQELISLATDSIGRELVYGTNTRGSAEYRRQISGALLRKAILEVQTHADSTDR